MPMKDAVRRLWRDESGQSLAEYGLLAALVALFVVGAMYFMGGKLRDVLTRIGNCLGAAATQGGAPSGC